MSISGTDKLEGRQHCDLTQNTTNSYVTRIRHWERVSHIRYVSDTDTCPMLLGYVSSEYPIFSFFREYWIRQSIRIWLADTAQPNNSRLPCPSVPDALASDARTPAPRAASPCSDAASPLAGRRPPATSLCSPATRPARPHSAVLGGGHPLRPDVGRDIQRGGWAARRQQRGGSGGDV